MSLTHAAIILAGSLSQSIAVGLIGIMLIQPRRKLLNDLFALFLAALGLWAYTSVARIVPALTPLSPEHNFYLLFMALALTPFTLYLFVTALCKRGPRVSIALSVWGVIGMIVLAILLWSGEIVTYLPEGGGTLGFEMGWPGYVTLGIVMLYGVLAYLFLQASDDPQAQPLRLPAALLVLGYGGNIFEPLRRIPLDLMLTTVAALLIGYAVLRWQLFIPLREANEKLRVMNADLRTAVNDLSAEKARTERLNDELRDASRYKSQFLTSISHELRTPLNSIVGYSELLVTGVYGDLSEIQHDRIEKIHRNGRSLLTLINDILDLSRIEGGRLELQLAPLHLESVLDSILATIQPMISSKQLVLKTDINAPLRPIRGDETRIRQIFLNLLTNAVKFTTAGHVHLKACNVTVRDGASPDFPLPVKGWLEDRHWIVISVEDTGPGIPPEDQAAIFEEFWQGRQIAGQQEEGVGLGLAIARRLVEMHAGRIWVRSEPDVGSTFYVALPAQDRDEPPPA